MYFRINSYIVGCKYTSYAVRVSTSLWINSYIVGCKCAIYNDTEHSDYRINSYIVGCKLVKNSMIFLNICELIVT